jgi:ribosomal protein S18 acetylase RimI-like enzyme
MRVRSATVRDVDSLIEVHRQAFPGFFLTLLGPGFLRLLYGEMIVDRNGIVVVAVQDRRVAGFAAGVLDQTAFFSRLKSKKWAFARAAAVRAVIRPRYIPRLVRGLKRSEEGRTYSSATCLLSLGVHPTMQGTQIGQTLINAFTTAVRARGASDVCLTTDGDDNGGARRFYERNGFVVKRVYATPEGRRMIEYYLSL